MQFFTVGAIFRLVAKSAKSSRSQPAGAANPALDWYFDDAASWGKEIRKLRAIALGCGLSEEMKWGCPCYTLTERNVVLIHVFKEYCALLFFKGALLEDDQRVLVQQTKNVQAARQIRFTNLAEVVKFEPAARAYILQAVAVEKSGRRVKLKETAEFAMPAEFKVRLKELPALKKAFHALTPGRQRAYLLHFSTAKQSKTRVARIEKCLERIFAGKGLDD